MVPLIAGIVIAGVIALFIYFLVVGSKKHEAERRDVFQAFARKHGFAFSEEDIYGLKGKIKGLGAIGFAENKLLNIAFSKEDNTRFYLFDQVKVVTRGGSKGGFFTICLVEGDQDFGAYIILNEAENKLAAKLARKLGGARAGMTLVELGDPVFDNTYVVFTDNSAAAKKLLESAVRSYLLQYSRKLPMPVVVQIKDNMVAAHNTGLSSRTIRETEHLQVLCELTKGLNDMLSRN